MNTRLGCFEIPSFFITISAWKLMQEKGKMLFEPHTQAVEKKKDEDG